VKAAQQLLGPQTIGGGNARAVGDGGGSKRRQTSPQLAEIHKNGGEKGWFPELFAQKSPKMLFFAKKYYIRNNPKVFLEEYINLKKMLLLKVFQESYTHGGKIIARGTSGVVSIHLKSSYTNSKVIF
jgi:hypothetical protein